MHSHHSSAESVRVCAQECGELDALALTLPDFSDARGRIQPSVSSGDAALYEQWASEFGST